MIQVDGLQKSYGSHKAVDGVSFEISKGETFGLLGPNGAGKTTTLSMLVGLLRPDGGSVRIEGADPANPNTRLRIGIAPQALSLYEELSAEENLRFFTQLYDYSGGELKSRVEWALEFAALADRRKSRVSTFSGGMKRRLNMACAMIHEPDVILLDEPTVGVDPQSRNHIFERIEELKQQGRTIIYTTHYMEAAQRLCDRIGVIDGGKILAIDTVQNLIKDHGGDSLVEAELKQPPNDESVLPAKLDDKNKLTFASNDPLKQILELSHAGVDVATLQIRQPDLECVFLNLTGRSLRDD
jgi:ABC-2 type transport system ATP-binding protein